MAPDLNAGRGDQMSGHMTSTSARAFSGSLDHCRLVLNEWKALRNCLEGKRVPIRIRGRGLDIPSVVAVSRYGIAAEVDKTTAVVEAVEESVKFMSDGLAAGRSFYGITTGFGGSADTRTRKVEALQVGLCQHLQAGILPLRKQTSDDVFDQLYASDNISAVLSMPETWVRGAMLIRGNSLIRGHSGVRLALIENLLELLSKDCIPYVPLRGSISASGDLHPLSYIAGLLEGNPDILIWTGKGSERKLVPAHQVLSEQGVDRLVFGPKEGLGVTNGTAVSAGVASLALHDANNFALLVQVLTAMSSEALLGTPDNFDPFIAEIRPHPGQIEAAHNIFTFLRGSLLSRIAIGKVDPGGLKQDRYPLRTSCQWLSPVLEDLQLSHSQLLTELNSTTDNPLIDCHAQMIHHGGNFQAAAVTLSTEKTRLSLQMLGKLLFGLSTELLDVKMNNGLPPNLCADEPSLSYTFKGIDVNMASYASELAFIASPVSTHVQSAEMGNQAINSMALVSARYTHTAVELVSLMCAAHLYSVCQALDLRVMQARFLGSLGPLIESINTSIFHDVLSRKQIQQLGTILWPVILKALEHNRSDDSTDRFVHVAKATTSVIVDTLEPLAAVANSLALVKAWTTEFSTQSLALFLANREQYTANPDATPYLGLASRKMYLFVRKELGVPMHKGIVDHPVADGLAEVEEVEILGSKNAKGKRTIGSWLSVLYGSLRSGRLLVPVMECFEEVLLGG